jgi:hypothetical protein
MSREMPPFTGMAFPSSELPAQGCHRDAVLLRDLKNAQNVLFIAGIDHAFGGKLLLVALVSAVAFEVFGRGRDNVSQPVPERIHPRLSHLS